MSNEIESLFGIAEKRFNRDEDRNNFHRSTRMFTEALAQYQDNPEREPELREAVPILQRLHAVVTERNAPLDEDLPEEDINAIFAGAENIAFSYKALQPDFTPYGILLHVMNTTLSRRDMRLYRESRNN